MKGIENHISKIEIELIENLVGRQIENCIFDSLDETKDEMGNNKTNWKINNSNFDYCLKNKSHFIIIIETTNGNKFGCYISNMIRRINEYIEDPEAFLFKIENNQIKKYEIKETKNAIKIFNEHDEHLFVIGKGKTLFGVSGDIVIKKEDKKEQCSCKQRSYEYHGRMNVLVGDNGTFEVKKIGVIQMKLTEEEIQTQFEEVVGLFGDSMKKIEGFDFFDTTIINVVKNEVKPFKVSDEYEMIMLLADNLDFPLKADTWELNFELQKDKAKVGKEYEQTIFIMNPTRKTYFFEILSSESHRYGLKIYPQQATLKPGTGIEVRFTIMMLCTTIMKDEISIVTMDMDDNVKETAKMTIKIESDLSIKLDHTELQLEDKPIGEGTFGIVFRGMYRGQNVAVKKMRERILTDENKKKINNEVRLMNQYKHQTITRFIGGIFTEGEVSIVMELAEYGSLTKLWGKNTLTYDLNVKIMEDISVALSYLHENQIIHRDVKSSNILVYSLNPHSLICGKLTDFGTCRNISERSLLKKELTKGIGTPTYMAPECLGINNYDIRADIYSFGIVMYETYIEREAYDTKNDERFKQPWMIPQFVFEGKRLERPKGMPGDYWDLMKHCWQQDPNERPLFPQIYATLASLKNINIKHTEMNIRAEGLDVSTSWN